MNYIVFDLEFNQDLSSITDKQEELSSFPYEIIEIGAIKLDSSLTALHSFRGYVKPSIYARINPFVTELTGITTEQLQTEDTFTKVYRNFIDFIGNADTVFCIWGKSDLKVLFQNVRYHHLNHDLLPRKYINIQPYVSLHFGYPSNKLLKLQNAVAAFHIPLTYEFHNAIGDAYYTGEILKKIFHPSLHPKVYEPFAVAGKPRQSKREINYDGLIKQFEKMYARSMTEEEQAMILLSYKMGRTNQFLK